MKKRTYVGTPPVNGLLIGDNGEYQLYLRPDTSTEKFLNLKLISKSRAEKKANWWLGWSVHEERFANGKDLAALEEHRPQLVVFVRDSLESYGV